MTNTPTLTTFKDEAEPVAGSMTEATDILAGLKVDIGFLSMAVAENDPHSELRLRVNDIREAVSRITAALAHPPTAIVDEGMVERAKRQIILAMQMQDFGHNGTGGDFNTNPRKIELLEACAETAARSVLALSAALQAGDGTGMVLVPAEPTQEMLEAGSDAQMLYSHPRKIWQAMLSASSGGTGE